MKINRACDLSSISVLPPHVRKPNTASNGFQSSQPRSQPSQQPFSHGLSSQHTMLSQLSQNSLDEAVINEQRVCSQDHENSARRNSGLPRLTYSREESQPPSLKSSSNLVRKWNATDHQSESSERLEHRLGIMETSLSRFAMILDSVQSDVMQINKGTKETNLEMECIRQKLIIHENSQQLMIKQQEEIKASIDGSLKSLSEQLCMVTSQENLREVSSVVSTLPQLIETSLRSLQNELDSTFTKKMQEISNSLKRLNQNDLARSTPCTKSMSNQVITSKKPQPPVNVGKISLHATVAPDVEMGGWRAVKKARVAEKVRKQKDPCTEKYVRGEGRDCAIIIESDEETTRSCSYFVQEKAAGLYENFTKEEDEEAQRILQKARQRKRKRKAKIKVGCNDGSKPVNVTDVIRKSNRTRKLPWKLIYEV